VDDSEARARRRRREWTGGVASSFAELAEIDRRAWLQVEPSERLGMVFDMWAEQSSESFDLEARLQKSVCGIRPRKG
jgi:hypothetical protein